MVEFSRMIFGELWKGKKMKRSLMQTVDKVPAPSGWDFAIELQESKE